MSDKIIRIAIDGPSGAGKSSIAKAVAQKIGIEYIDTGAMYRAFAYKMIKQSVDAQDRDAVKALLIDTEIDFKNGNTMLDGEDISDRIRTPEISKMASVCSAYPEVRTKLVELQQAMGRRKSVIMDGRDICEKVLPEAEYKFFLTASAEERANRRYKELLEKGDNISYAEVLEDMKKRDFADSTRAESPLRKAADAEEIDSSNMTKEEVIDTILRKIGEL